MNEYCSRASVLFLTACLFLAGDARAANVDARTGYTNAFTTQPPAADWATYSRTGLPSDPYDMDSDVNAMITLTRVVAQPGSRTASPPAAFPAATWSSAGLYLQTRPAANAYTVLMGKFVNDTGTNATGIALSYRFTVAAGGGLEDTDKGTRVYYSLTGASNSWMNLPSLTTTSWVDGTTIVSTNLALSWPNGSSLFMVWVDDNSAAIGDEPANQIDDFSLQVTGGSAEPFSCVLTAPTNHAAFLPSTSVAAAATIRVGTPPYTVEYFTNSGVANPVFASAGSSATAPHSLSLGPLPVDTYNIYAVATDSSEPAATTTSWTNTFGVADPILITLTAPVQDATFDYLTSVEGAATVSGGTPPYAVQFYVDSVPHGTPVTAEPYTHDFGLLSPGDRAIKATVRDAGGWVSNSLVHTVHVIGPLTVTLAPTNGTAYYYGQSVTLTAAVLFGTAPHTVSFYTNDQLLGSVTNPPFTWDLGVLPIGSYTSRVHVVDSAAPTPEQAGSSTNVFTILFNPVLISPRSVWRYLDTGVNLSNAWVSPAYDDSPWAAGPAELGYGDSTDGRPEATVVSYGPNAASKFITTYFRRTFLVANAASCTNLYARFLCDDGAVIYLNGVEVSRYNLPSALITNQTPAIEAIAGTDETIYLWSRRISPALLVEGANCMAVEVHQSSANSSDLSFDLELRGNVAGPVRTLPLGAGQRGTVRCVDVPEKSYDLYLPQTYTATGTPRPILFTFNPDGGGMVQDFTNVAAPLNLILVGVFESRNEFETLDVADALHAVFRDVRERVNFDPTAVFAGGFSGGAVVSHDCSRIFGQHMAGVLSMSGWLGYEPNAYVSQLRVRTNLLVARLLGDSDAMGFYYLGPDADLLRSYGAVVQDWTFSGGHQVAPDAYKTLALTWLLNQHIPAGTNDRTNAMTLAASWRSRLAAGQTEAVMRECLNTLMTKPRTWESFYADWVMDDVQANFSTFRRIDVSDLAGGNFAQDYFYYRACIAGASRDLDIYFSSLKALTGVTNHNGDLVPYIPNALATYGTPAPLILAAASDGSGQVELLFSRDSLGLNYWVERRTDAGSGSWTPVTGVESNRGHSVWSIGLPAGDVPSAFFRLKATVD